MFGAAAKDLRPPLFLHGKTESFSIQESSLPERRVPAEKSDPRKEARLAGRHRNGGTGFTVVKKNLSFFCSKT